MGYLCFLQSFWVYSLLFCLCIFKRHSLDCWQLAGFVLGWLVWGFFFCSENASFKLFDHCQGPVVYLLSSVVASV